MMMVAQPEDQLAFQALAFFGAELCATLRPPFANAAVANQFAAIEKNARIPAAEKLLASGARTDAEQAQGILQSVEVELLAGQNVFYARLGFFGHKLVPATKVYAFRIYRGAP